MLPKKNGFDVCRALRDQGSSVPVIILTAREEEADKVLGLEIGADDYITKPFSMRELVARVGANIRRTTMTPPAAASAAASAMPVSGDLSINTDSHQVFRAGKAIDLTQREYELLTFLASHPNKVYSRIDLMEQVWNYGYVGDDVRTVDVTVRRLREKIDQDSARVRRQQAVYQLQHGGLSAAGPADDRHKCARLHIQREVPQNGLGAEGLGDAFKANDRLGHITPPAGPSGAGSPWPHPARSGPPPPPGS